MINLFHLIMYLKKIHFFNIHLLILVILILIYNFIFDFVILMYIMSIFK